MNNHIAKQLYDLDEHFLLSRKKLENTGVGPTQKIEYIEIRWKYLKKEEILSDMNQILRFSEPSEVPLLKRNSVYKEMKLLLLVLGEKKWGKFHSRVIAIMEKYLKGIEKFLSKSKIQAIHLYRKLFEGTMIAIIEEVKKP